MTLRNIQIVQNEVAIAWDDGTESYIPLEKMRRACPCAVCAGERDILGREYRMPPQPLDAKSFTVEGVQAVGGYAVQITWGDGHNTGIYTHDLLQHLGAP